MSNLPLMDWLRMDLIDMNTANALTHHALTPPVEPLANLDDELIPGRDALGTPINQTNEE